MAPRGKVVLARINNDRKRKESLRKRKPGLVKKVSELATLCGLEAAVVIYSPGDNQPTVWPSTSEARATISKFLSRPKAERMARSHTAKSLAKEKCKKLKRKAERLIKKNEKRIIKILISSMKNGKTKIQDLDSEQKEKLKAFTDKKRKELHKHVQKFKRKEQQTPHLPQVFPTALRMPPTGQEASGPKHERSLAAGRNFPSPSASHGQLNCRDMTPLAPHPFFLPMHNPLIMLPDNSAAKGLDMTRRLHGQTTLGFIMQRAPHTPQVLRPVQQMRTVSHTTKGLNMNGFASSRNFPTSTAAAHGQHMNLTGTTRGASSPLPLSVPTASPLVMSHNNGTANSLDISQRFYGQTNLGGTSHNPPPSPLSMPPTLSTVPILFAAGGIPDVSDYSLLQRGPPPYMPLELPRRLGLPPTLPTEYEASGSNMIGNDRRWNTNGFPTPATARLDQSDSNDGTSIGRWVDIDATSEVNNAPPFTVKW